MSILITQLNLESNHIQNNNKYNFHQKIKHSSIAEPVKDKQSLKSISKKSVKM
jgi:hypothetical protein